MTQNVDMFHLILPDESGRRVLLLPVGDEWTLPHCDVAVSDDADLMATIYLNEAVAGQYGIHATKLHALDMRDAEDTMKIAAMENHTHGWKPPEGSRWISNEMLSDLTFVRPIVRQVLEAWFTEEAEDDTKEPIMPWTKIGWFGEASEWILMQLQHLGINARSPVEQVKSFYTGGTLRVDTDIGYAYFKALPHAFVRELENTQVLVRWIPESVPVLLAADPERRWMLQQDIGGTELEKITDLKVWEDVMRMYAQLQVASLEFVNEMLYGPFYDYRIQTMKSTMDSVIANVLSLLRGYQEPLSDTELAELKAVSPLLKNLCDEVEGYGIPCALEHGDFRPGNIRITKDGPVFFDWSWSCVTHPFLGAVGLLHIAGRSVPGVSSAREKLRDTYLEAWGDYGILGGLRKLFDLINRWRILHAVLIDAEWVSEYQKKLSGSPVQYSFTEWALRRRQYYLAKVLRRLPGSVLS